MAPYGPMSNGHTAAPNYGAPAAYDMSNSQTYIPLSSHTGYGGLDSGAMPNTMGTSGSMPVQYQQQQDSYPTLALGSGAAHQHPMNGHNLAYPPIASGSTSSGMHDTYPTPTPMLSMSNDNFLQIGALYANFEQNTLEDIPPMYNASFADGNMNYDGTE